MEDEEDGKSGQGTTASAMRSNRKPAPKRVKSEVAKGEDEALAARKRAERRVVYVLIPIRGAPGLFLRVRMGDALSARRNVWSIVDRKGHVLASGLTKKEAIDSVHYTIDDEEDDVIDPLSM